VTHISSTKQRGDLEQQCHDLRDTIKTGKAGEEAQTATRTKDVEIITDARSGLDWKTHKGIQGLLERVLQGMVRMIVVLHKDCLCHFAFDLIEWLCLQHDCKIIMVHSHRGATETTQELADNLFTITNVFVARHNRKMILYTYNSITPHGEHDTTRLHSIILVI